MKSFVERIDEHIRKEGIPFNQIVIPESYLPTYINYAILQIFNKYVDKGDKYLLWPKEYTLEYDSGNRLCLKGVLDKGKDVILIFGNTDFYTGRTKDFGRKVSDLDLYDYALILKQFESVRERVYREIDKKYGKNISIKERNNIRYESMKDFYLSKYYEYGSNIRKIISLEDELDKSVDKILSYIDYLNELYQKDIESYRNEKMVYISYEEKENTEHKKVVRTGMTTGKERKNEVISMEDRREVLEGYDYDFFGIATASNKMKKDYYCYLYKDFEGRSILVLEPYCGTKYTKVIYLDTKDLSKEEFREICTKALELSNEDTFNYDNIIRLSHTTLDKFNSNMGRILHNANETKRKDDFKAKVRDNRKNIVKTLI